MHPITSFESLISFLPPYLNILIHSKILKFISFLRVNDMLFYGVHYNSLTTKPMVVLPWVHDHLCIDRRFH